MTIKRTSTASVLAGALVFTLASAAFAAPAAVNRNPAKVADAGQAHATAVNDNEDESSGNCSKSRKRLWSESEGWIVRKVTTCR